MQYAPGYVKYDTRFPDFWNKIVEDEDLDEVYPILIRIIRKAFTKMYSPDFDIKDLIPQMGASMLCKNCGVNHEARDFIRA